MFTEVYLIHTAFRNLALLPASGRICIIKPVLLVPLDPAVLSLYLFLEVSRLTFYVYLLFPQACCIFYFIYLPGEACVELLRKKNE
jgi:hypothetical protein